MWRRHIPITALVVLSLLPLRGAAREETRFRTAAACLPCHNGLTTPAGQEVSIGFDWRGSMMANAARDPYWQAAVRREIQDHPGARAAIEDKCSTCHMPMMRFAAKARQEQGQVFTHLAQDGASPATQLAQDGVSCPVCHQIEQSGFGTKDSFTGGFVIDTTRPWGQRHAYGPYQITPGRERIMRSASAFQPAESLHVQQSELCATCHTLFTHALGPAGEVLGELPEQVPYLEWRHSAYRTSQSCQACHMPTVAQPTAMSSVLGEPRAGFSRHVFRGGNSFMPRLFARYRTELGIPALPQELAATATRTARHLQDSAATIAITNTSVASGQLTAEVVVTNLAGHKLPTAYPSRRAWLHVTVRNREGREVFASGTMTPAGSIHGNDNDAHPRRFEPHHDEIRSGDQVQVYEAIMGDRHGEVTTGLLSGVRYLKDNRLLPRGFDKATAEADIAVRGVATRDEDFSATGDRVRYVVTVVEDQGPFAIAAELWYQPIGYRWAENLRGVRAPETERFVGYYEALAAASAIVLARTAATTTDSTPAPQGKVNAHAP